MADEVDFDSFVSARSQALLRTAYLLVQDEGLAEDLLQTALAKAWFAWRRVQDPEAYVRRILVTTSASWWRRRWTRETPTADLPESAGGQGEDAATRQDLWEAVVHLPKRQRAVVVLPLPRGPHRRRDGRPHGLLGEHREEPVREGARQAARRRRGGAGLRREEPVMNTDDLQGLAHRADGVEGRPAVRLDEVRDRIRTARRRRAAVAAVGAVAAVLAVVVGTTLVSDPKGRSQDPVKPTPSPSETFEVPTGQSTTRADVRPGDVRDLKAIATLTNTRPEHRGATDLGTTVMVHSETTYVVRYCHSADPSVWFFLSFTDGGGAYGRCNDGSTALPPPDLPVLEYDHSVPQPTTVRMYVARLSPEVRSCYVKSVEDCQGLYGSPQPLATTDAEFGFRVYDHTGARVVLRLFGYTYQALSTRDGEPWIVDRAVVAGRGADRLAVRLPDTRHRWIVGVFDEGTRHMDACAHRHGLDTNDEGQRLAWRRALQRACGVRLRLLVDGAFQRHVGGFDSSYGEPWTYVSPGAHEVTVDVTRGDPRNVRYAIIIWRAGS